jgi:Glycosyltransferase family 87
VKDFRGVGGALLGLLALLLIVGAGVLVSVEVRVEGAAALLLTVYVVGFAEVVGLSLLLSLSGALTRGGLVGGTALVFGIAAAVWVWKGMRPFPRIELRRLQRLVDTPQSLALAVAATVALGYVLALLLGTPPNGWDPLNYHLSRVAFWLQSHRIGYIEPAYDERMNLNLPNGEIGSAFALGVTRNEMTTGLVQFFAALASAVAVAGLARRIGMSAREAAFGALLFLTLPIVILQASLSKNDLVVASLLLVAAYFLLGDRRRDAALAALATALAVGTKTTALYGLVVLLALAVLAVPRRARAVRLAAVCAGAVAGAYWYIVNLVETHHFFGDQSAQQNVTATLHPRSDIVTAYGVLVDFLDLSGARGKDILIYLIAAAVVAGAVFAVSRSRRAFAIVGLGAVPLLILALAEHVGRPSLVHLSNAVHDPRGYLAAGTPQASPTIASDTASWFGPVGLLCLVGAVVYVILRRPRGVAALFAVAPVVWFVLVALTLSYNPFLGRFFIFPVALSAALWGATLARPHVATGLTVLAVVTAGLSLVHYAEKPSGIRLADRTATRSVWNMPRWEVQSQHDPALAPVLQFVDGIPSHASIALALSDNGFGYPVFGPHLTRNVELVGSGSDARTMHDDWLYASRDRAPQIDASCWQKQLESVEGTIFKRIAGCPAG